MPSMKDTFKNKLAAQGWEDGEHERLNKQKMSVSVPIEVWSEFIIALKIGIGEDVGGHTIPPEGKEELKSLVGKWANKSSFR